MKFKYMLRGFGIGVIITACIMGAYNRDAVAKARVTVLRQYGLGGELTESEEDSQTQESTQEQDSSEHMTSARDEEAEAKISAAVEAAKEAERSEQESTTAPEMQESDTVPEADEEPVSSKEQEEGNVIVVEPTDQTPETNKGTSVQITVAPGDDSGTVSRKLYNAGIIENAGEYDAFLMQHGYDKRINTGTKTIYATDSWQEIAEKLTTK